MESAKREVRAATPLLLVMADLRNRQALYSEAIDIYREVLQKTPDNSSP